MAKIWYSAKGNRVSRRKARKMHECKECLGVILEKEHYYEITFQGDDCRYHTVRVCVECWVNNTQNQ